MKTTMDRFAVIREWDIDLLLLEEFWCSPPFVTWFYQRAREANERLPILESVVCTARHSVSYSGEGSGESDLEVTISGKGSAGEFSALFLIEDKIDAQFTADQPERYRKRAEMVRSERGNTVSMTVIVAPRRYLENVSSESFDMKIAYEELIEQIQSPDEQPLSEIERRKEHRSLMLAHAIEKCRRGGQRVNDDERTQFFDDYFDIVRKNEPALQQKPRRGRSLGSDKFFYDITPRLSAGVGKLFLEHRLKEGWVGIEFRGWGSRREWYVPKLQGIIDEDMTIDQPSGKTIIRVQLLGLPRLDLNKPISEQSDSVKNCVHGAARLLKWYRAHYSKLEDWVKSG
ncbi:MAG: hypothetical protein H6822_10385 [Planctomycetaceae bacterium]|nr:hypothetical protein [Planctomycetaceae bacterium]